MYRAGCIRVRPTPSKLVFICLTLDVDSELQHYKGGLALRG